ncbi:hypothetical protein PTKIN_Ptkin10aG0012900 [Pterospermum kingtungense]
MLDPSEKGSDSEDQDKKNPEVISPKETKKTCADCGTSKTSLWRGGPAGPKSLCNACGIRSRKKRNSILGLNKREEHHKKSKNKRRKLGEEEQAAVLLMALSYGSVYG